MLAQLSFFGPHLGLLCVKRVFQVIFIYVYQYRLLCKSLENQFFVESKLLLH